MKNIAIFTVLGMQLITPSSAFAQNTEDYSGVYLCFEDASGCISYDDASKMWVGTKFRSDDRYILTVKSNGLVNDFLDIPNMTYIITWEKHGANWDPLSKGCWTESNKLREINPMSSWAPGGDLSCNLKGGQLKVNFNTLRFLNTYLKGYIDGVDDNSNTPFINVGTCTKID